MNTEGIKLLKDTEEKDHFLFEEITQQALDSKAIYGLIAFVTQRGFFTPIKETEKSLSECLLPLLKNGNSKLIFSLLNDENNINEVVKFSSKNGLKSLRFPEEQDVKIHDKVILFEKNSGLFSVIIGSHNWTSYALHKENSPFNSETSILLKDLHIEDEIVQKLLNYIRDLKTLSITEENKKVIIDQNKKRLKLIWNYLSGRARRQLELKYMIAIKQKLDIQIHNFYAESIEEVRLYLLISNKTWSNLKPSDQKKLSLNGKRFKIICGGKSLDVEIFYSKFKKEPDTFNQDLTDFNFYSVINDFPSLSRISKFENFENYLKFNEIREHSEWQNEISYQVGLKFIAIENKSVAHKNAEDFCSISFDYKQP